MSSNDHFGQNQYAPAQLEPQIPRPSGNNTAIIIGASLVAVVFLLLICVGILAALLLPAVQAAREAARRMQCSNNMKQISLAMHNYASDYGSFPPAYTVDAAGNKLHSWRTLLLPYMDQQALYNQIDLTKPWDDPANEMFANMEIPVYRCPSTATNPSMTTYVVVVDPSAVYSGAEGCKLQDISDGTANTLLVFETEPAFAVNWMSPEDASPAAFPPAGRTGHPGGCNCAMADGSVHFISQNIDPPVADALITKAGGEAEAASAMGY